MPPLARNYNKHYTYRDYYSWNDDERWELLEGIPYNMSPAPNPEHQEILGELSRQFLNHFANKPCKVYFAPFDVRLSSRKKPKDEDITTVVQPDLVVICDKNKIDNRGCIGAPDLVIEILSPFTAKKDMSEKFNLYEKYDVKEYWIADPGNKVIHVYYLNEKKKYAIKKIYEKDEIIESTCFPELRIDLTTIFTQ